MVGHGKKAPTLLQNCKRVGHNKKSDGLEGPAISLQDPLVVPRVPVVEMHLFQEREFFIDNLLVRIHCIIVMIRWTGLAPWEFEFTVPGSLTSTFLFQEET